VKEPKKTAAEKDKGVQQFSLFVKTLHPRHWREPLQQQIPVRIASVWCGQKTCRSALLQGSSTSPTYFDKWHISFRSANWSLPGPALALLLFATSPNWLCFSTKWCIHTYCTTISIQSFCRSTRPHDGSRQFGWCIRQIWILWIMASRAHCNVGKGQYNNSPQCGLPEAKHSARVGPP
jgi:hypothetical protein